MATNSDLLARRGTAVARGVATAYPVFAARAQGAELWDIQGKRYIDFAGGIGVLNTGHRHPKILAAVARQIDAFTHTAFQVIGYEPYIAVCEGLNQLAPFTDPAKSILFSTGAEAVENSIKIARAATRRPGVIAFSGAFHGRTSLTMALTGKVAPYKQQFGLSPPGIHHLPFPSEDSDSVERTLQALELLLRSDIAPSDVAAIIIEPVQGEGGFLVAPAALLRRLREVCDRYGILLIADEVQSGFARTGKFFAVEHSGVQPDLVTTAKSLAAGFPLSAVIGRADIIDAVEPGGLGGTYAGNPIACAAALAVMEIIRDEQLLDRANVLGSRLKEHLAMLSLQSNSLPISGIRGPGAMVAFDVVTSNRLPDGAAARGLAATALEAGLLILTCGVHGNTVRALFPLTITDDVFAEALNILERSCAK